MHTIARYVTGLLCALTAASVVAAAEAPGLDDWIRGPVRYLLSRSEEKTFEKLKTDQEKALFIVRFWRALDPTPGTLDNENKEEFRRRVAEANRRFRDSTRPGWMTDRGRFYILLGEPDDTEVNENPEVSDLPTTGPLSGIQPPQPTDAASDAGRVRVESTRRGLLRWVYRNVPGRSTDPELMIAFTRDASGEWRVSRRPANYNPEFLGIGDGGTFTVGGITARVSGQSPAGDSGFDMIEQTRLLSETGRAMLIGLDIGETARAAATIGAGIVTAAEFLDRFPLSPRFEYFKAADGNTAVRAGVSVRSGSIYGAGENPPGTVGSFLFLYAAFTPASGDGETRYARNETEPTPVSPGQITDPDALVEAWVSRTLEPGEYDVSLGVQDAATGLASSLRASLTVPDFRQGSPVLSSITPVERLEPAAGSLEPDPRVSAVYGRDEELGIYYQVYNLATEGDRRLFDATYRFYALTDEGERALGKPVVYADLSEPVQGWSVPLERWPAGSYRLEVRVEDRIGAGSDEASVTFEVR